MCIHMGANVNIILLITWYFLKESWPEKKRLCCYTVCMCDGGTRSSAKCHMKALQGYSFKQPCSYICCCGFSHSIAHGGEQALRKCASKVVEEMCVNIRLMMGVGYQHFISCIIRDSVPKLHFCYVHLNLTSTLQEHTALGSQIFF